MPSKYEAVLTLPQADDEAVYGQVKAFWLADATSSGRRGFLFSLARCGECCVRSLSHGNIDELLVLQATAGKYLKNIVSL